MNTGQSRSLTEMISRLDIRNKVKFLIGLAKGNCINEKELRVFAIKRSGQHAIINWIMNQEKGKIIFFNDIRTDKHINPAAAFDWVIAKVNGRRTGYM